MPIHTKSLKISSKVFDSVLGRPRTYAISLKYTSINKLKSPALSPTNRITKPLSRTQSIFIKNICYING